jgi:type II secretion system protein G
MTNKIINKKNKGFTLVELLVVISIMGILTVMVASTFTGAQQKSRDAARKANIKAIADALNMYYGDFGVYPDSGNFNIDIRDNHDFTENGVIYMKKMPNETSTLVKGFYYETGSHNKSFKLFASLENIKDGDCRQCNDYTVNSGTCCYAVTSSNIDYSTDVSSMP